MLIKDNSDNYTPERRRQLRQFKRIDFIDASLMLIVLKKTTLIKDNPDNYTPERRRQLRQLIILLVLLTNAERCILLGKNKR